MLVYWVDAVVEAAGVAAWVDGRRRRMGGGGVQEELMDAWCGRGTDGYGCIRGDSTNART